MKDLALSLILIALLILVVNPMHFWMPSSAHMGVLGALVAGFGLLAIFFIRERVEDEREERHRALAGRVAFLAGAGVLLAGIVVQGLSGAVDWWLALALAGMVFAKIGARLYSDTYQ